MPLWCKNGVVHEQLYREIAFATQSPVFVKKSMTMRKCIIMDFLFYHAGYQNNHCKCRFWVHFWDSKHYLLVRKIYQKMTPPLSSGSEADSYLLCAALSQCVPGQQVLDYILLEQICILCRFHQPGQVFIRIQTSLNRSLDYTEHNCAAGGSVPLLFVVRGNIYAMLLAPLAHTHTTVPALGYDLPPLCQFVRKRSTIRTLPTSVILCDNRLHLEKL